MFEAHFSQLTLSGNKGMQRVLPDNGKFNLFDTPNHDDYNDVFSILVKLGGQAHSQ